MEEFGLEEFVFGFHPLRELLRHRPLSVSRVMVAAQPGKRRREIEDLCRRRGIAVVETTNAELSRRSKGQTHNGFGAEVKAPAAASAGADRSLVVLAEDIQDPRNLGALMRVCEGAGVGKVLLRDRGTAPLGAAAAKTSAGASEWLDVQRVANTTREIERLRSEGFWIYGAAAEGAPPWELDLTGQVALVIGGEAEGLRRLTRESCDALVGLPMRGRVSSLNLATAAAALLYEAVRQRS